MECDKCKAIINEEESKELHGRILCEDCYMDSLSPARMCDPWAVYSAKSLMDKNESGLEVNEIQAKILRILEKTGGKEPGTIADNIKIKPSDLERELAALRHMEKVRGALKDGKKIICLW
ncbi:MAG: hypothetical protein JRI28_03980 [Deltaproteobacteria bacterium]|nr:hypothetical protein [Deltaproteobacteria bacterium]